MKKLLFIGFSFCLIFASCKKSKDETPAGFQWPEGTGPYAPYTIGSTFTYETQATTPVAIDSFTYTVTKDTTIDGAKYKKIESNKPALASGFYCNYNNGIRTEITYNSAIAGITIPTIKQIVLKDNVAVSSNWMETLNITVPTIPIPIPVTFNYTVQQKDFTKNILSKDYAKTIFVKQVASLPSGLPLPSGTPSSITVDNFFADGFGIVERDLPNTAIKIKRANVIK
jgi:hypothetical protein